MPLCLPLNWDSDFFDCRIARIAVERPLAEDWPTILDWCTQHKIDCLYYLAEFGDIANLHTASELGFRLMDLRMTLARRVEPSDWPDGIRVATPADIPHAQAIATRAFGETRFSRDPQFAGRAGLLYETWVQRNIEGLAECVLLSHTPTGELAGFVSCHLRGPEQGEVGLTAVRADHRGTGVGARLVRAALAWFHEQRLASAFVITNGGNFAAQRLYQRHGFLSQNTQIWYHRWFHPI